MWTEQLQKEPPKLVELNLSGVVWSQYGIKHVFGIDLDQIRSIHAGWTDHYCKKLADYTCKQK